MGRANPGRRGGAGGRPRGRLHHDPRCGDPGDDPRLSGIGASGRGPFCSGAQTLAADWGGRRRGRARRRVSGHRFLDSAGFGLHVDGMAEWLWRAPGRGGPGLCRLRGACHPRDPLSFTGPTGAAALRRGGLGHGMGHLRARDRGHSARADRLRGLRRSARALAGNSPSSGPAPRRPRGGARARRVLSSLRDRQRRVSAGGSAGPARRQRRRLGGRHRHHRSRRPRGFSALRHASPGDRGFRGDPRQRRVVHRDSPTCSPSADRCSSPRLPPSVSGASPPASG